MVETWIALYVVNGDAGMLILTRRIKETIMIGDSIIVEVLGIHGNQVRLGVTAPKETEVHRLEVWFRIQREKKEKKEQENGE